MNPVNPEQVTNIVVPSFVTPDFSWFGGSTNGDNVVSVIFAIVFIWWAIHTLVGIYHWARFGRMTWMAVPVVLIYLYGSAQLLVYITSGLH